MFIAAQIIGIVAMIFAIISFQQKTQKKILFFQLIGCCLFCVQYYLLNAIMGAVLNFIAIIRTLVYSQCDKKRWANSVFWVYFFTFLSVAFYVLTFLVFNMEPTTFNLIVEMLPVIGMTIHNVGFRMRNSFKVRLFYLIGTPLWITYAALRSSVGGVLVDVFNIISIIIGFIRIDRKTTKNEE